MVEINISNKTAYVLIGVLAIIIVAGLAIAWGSNDPELHGHDADEIEGVGLTCPTGFIIIEKQGYQLGCIQNDEEGSSASWFTATNDCFDTYGGRLPSIQEWYLAMNNYALNAEAEWWEWTTDRTYEQCYLVGSGSITTISWNYCNEATDYRCFIPA